MKAIDYIYNNLNCLNRPILAQFLEKENVELTDEIWDYLRETSWNTNPVFLRQFGIDIERSSEEGEEEWPKLIHIVRDEQASEWIMANDSDFATFSEAYHFIKDRWSPHDGTCTSEYIMLQFNNTDIYDDDGYLHITENDINWYNGGMIYRLTENNFTSLDDN